MGGPISGDSVRRITQGFGQQVAQQREQEVEAAYALPAEPQEVEPVNPIKERGNVSTDGTLLLVRGEGWKEVKLTVMSACELEQDKSQKGQRWSERRVRLKAHSCQAGLWGPDELGRYQYVEGKRRGLGECAVLTSVNDAAAWIERVTRENFPHAVQIIDWPHATQHLWMAAHALYGEGTPKAQQWGQQQERALWQGQVQEVVRVLDGWAERADMRSVRDYFQAHGRQMDYATYRRKGYPIGSGTVESAGKNYVQHRMRRSGRGWGRQTAQAMLSALSELHSGRFDRLWNQLA